MASNNLSNAAEKVFGVSTKGSRPLVPSQMAFHVALLVLRHPPKLMRSYGGESHF